MPPISQPRFLTPADVAELLSSSLPLVMSLIRRGELRAIQVGGRGQWRIEVSEFESYIARQYEKADAARAKIGRGATGLVAADDEHVVEADRH